MEFSRFWQRVPLKSERTLNQKDIEYIDSNKKVIQTAAVMMAITIVLQGSSVTSLDYTFAINALVICVRLSFFLNAAASFAAAENILAIANKGHDADGDHACFYSYLGLLGGAGFFLVTTIIWMWTHVLWAKIVTVLTIFCASGWALYNIELKAS